MIGGRCNLGNQCQCGNAPDKFECPRWIKPVTSERSEIVGMIKERIKFFKETASWNGQLMSDMCYIKKGALQELEHLLSQIEGKK